MKEVFYTVDNLCFVIPLFLLTLWMTFLTTKGSLTNDTFTKHWWKKYTNRGKKVISIGVMLLVLLIFQEFNNSNISTKNAIALKNEENSRDSLITVGIKKETTKLFTNLSSAFNEQGLQFDTIKNQIVSLQDSNKKSNLATPLIRVRNLEMEDSIDKWNRFTFSYEIISDNAVSYNTHLLFDVYGFTTEGKIVPLDFNQSVLYKGQTVAKEQRLTGHLTIIVNYQITTYAFRLKGFYYTSDKSKIKIDDFYLLRFNGKKMSFELPAQFHDTALREFINENNFK